MCRGPLAVFSYHFKCHTVRLCCQHCCADWFFGVFSRFCSISRVFCFSRVEGFVFLCWICVSPVADASRVNIPGSLVVVLVLTSVFLVKISD